MKEVFESRRPYLEPPSYDEDDFFPEEQDWETSGSGLVKDVDTLVKILELSLLSIEAGNTSIKLKNQVSYLLDSLVELGEIDEKQKKNYHLLYKTMSTAFDILLDSSLAKIQKMKIFHMILQ